MAAFAWVPLLGLPLLLWLMARCRPGTAALLRGDRRYWSRFFRSVTLTEWIAAALLLVLVKPAGLGLGPVPAWVWTGVPVSVVGLLVLARRAAPSPAAAAPAGFPLFAPWSQAERVLWVLLYAPSLAFCEELIFRGGGMAVLTPRVGPVTAAALQAVPFALLHAGGRQRPLELGARWAVGAALGLLVAAGGSLWATMALHGALDAFTAALPARRLSRPDRPPQ